MRDTLHASTELMGMILFGFSYRSMLVDLLIIAVALRHLPATSDGERSRQAHGAGFLAQILHELRDCHLLILSVVILVMALAEDSANDWLLLMIDGHNLNHTQGTLVYAGFTAGMTLGRFLGGLWWVSHRPRLDAAHQSFLRRVRPDAGDILR